jgi:hypothetical protein
MLSAPLVGSQAVVWYAAKRSGRKPGLVRSEAPCNRLHGQIVRVTVRGRGSPRNHMVVTLEGESIIIPAGYLRHLENQ